MSKICFGGSFNPVHVGHLICARAAAERLGFSTVVLIPSAQPPHKPGATDLAAAPERVKMCGLAMEGLVGFEVDDLETRRGGPSYTIDTARELAERGGPRVSWLIGADMLRSLPTWHEPDALLAEVDFHVLARPGWRFDWETMPLQFRKLRERVVEAPLIEISATEIRRRVRQGLPIDLLTPSKVVAHIHQTGLYRGPDSV
jgi:nicotinate-nucleotide adenylyltransferase